MRKIYRGKILAKTKNIPFIDLDQYIEYQQNMSVRELFKVKGELKFRKLEREALLELIEANTPAVIALGGGTPCYFDNMENHCLSPCIHLSQCCHSFAHFAFENGKSTTPIDYSFRKR